jgi:AraC family transcriptional regulator, transcriptional activator of pobA
MDNRHQPLNISNIVPRQISRAPAPATAPATAPASAAARARRPPVAAVPPAYALYGEPLQAGLPELMHLETIARRSRVHDWEIRPHRHAVLFQILVIATGSVQARLEGTLHDVHGPCALTVPAMAVHGFRFAPDIDGMVVTVPHRHVQLLLGDDAAWQAAVMQLRSLVPAPDALLQAAAALREDYRRPDPWRQAALETGLRRLLLELARAAPAAVPAGGTAAPARALQHVQRFQALVELRFRQQPGLATLAALLGITPTQLNRVCNRVLGHSALGVLHARLLLEAQRELGYTATSVKQVAIGLGFSDAGYFTRFFQRLTGLTPTAWRAAAGRAPIIAP